MKRLLVLFVSTLITTFAQSQCDTTIIGKWKVVSVKTAEVYFNLKTDSSFIEPDAVRNYPDTNRKLIIEMNKMAWGGVQFEFRKDSSFNLTFMQGLNEPGTYCFTNNNKLISITMKNGLGEDKTEKWQAYLKDQLLQMTIKLDDEDEEEKMVFVFERAGK